MDLVGESVAALMVVAYLASMRCAAAQRRAHRERLLLEGGSTPTQNFLPAVASLQRRELVIRYRKPDFGFLVNDKLIKPQKKRGSGYGRVSRDLERLGQASTATILMLLAAMAGIVLFMWALVHYPLCVVVGGGLVLAIYVILSSYCSPSELIVGAGGVAFGKSFGPLKFVSARIPFSQLVSANRAQYRCEMIKPVVPHDEMTLQAVHDSFEAPGISVASVDLTFSHLLLAQWLTCFPFLCALQARFEDGAIVVPLRLDAIAAEHDREMLKGLSTDTPRIAGASATTEIDTP